MIKKCDTSSCETGPSCKVIYEMKLLWLRMNTHWLTTCIIYLPVHRCSKLRSWASSSWLQNKGMGCRLQRLPEKAGWEEACDMVWRPKCSSPGDRYVSKPVSVRPGIIIDCLGCQCYTHFCCGGEWVDLVKSQTAASWSKASTRFCSLNEQE